MRHTARAIIIRQKRLLLVTGHGADFYWTPGGGLEEGETPEEALVREVREELGVAVIDHSLYLSYEFDDQAVTSYIATVEDSFVTGNEITQYLWFSKSDNIRLSKGLEKVLLPKLIADNLL